MGSKYTMPLTSCSYNQLEEDFPSLQEYNDYLEEVETIGTRSLLCPLTVGCVPCITPHVQCSTCVME